MAPFVEALLDAVDLCPGHQVLDVASGTGFVARAAAARVGPTGHVAAADFSEAMLKVAAAKAPRMYPDIEFTVAPADRLPHPDDTFDAVLCQQGVQFFPDLGAALVEASRVLRVGPVRRHRLGRPGPLPLLRGPPPRHHRVRRPGGRGALRDGLLLPRRTPHGGPHRRGLPRRGQP
ncbi:class I SAM-dependent methyltransferase [Streptomyces sp. IB201691-2A2]|uniref:class I SAM-dependent methyltransferase n=1 Tax=Streptomyces sp. IB201691-2A2 TaxID=2561920 RepID=UPI0021B0BB35|nr:methyltransferase domain-containing protein [Streptomyces sp. IB201691-2A2]